MPTYSLLREAILNKVVLSAQYDGYTRVFCPHVLGMGNNERKCLIYQISGDSESSMIEPGSPGNWRCVKVDEMKFAAVAKAGVWQTPQNYNGGGHCVTDPDVWV